MIAASGPIRIPTRRYPLHAISQFDKNSGRKPWRQAQHDETLLLTRRACAGKGCRRPLSRAGRPVRHRKQTVSGLRSVAVGDRMNPRWPQPGQHQRQPAQPPWPGHGGRRRGSGHDLAAIRRRTGLASRPGAPVPPILPNQSPSQFLNPGSAFPNSPRPASSVGPIAAGAAVTSPQDRRSQCEP